MRCVPVKTESLKTTRGWLAIFAVFALAGCTAGSRDDDELSTVDGGDGDGDGDGDGAGDGDGDGDGDSRYTSGSRIRARVVSTPDGATDLVGWRDTQLDIDCSFSDPGDGVLRCLPRALDLGGAFTEFADPDCTVPLVSEFVVCGVAASEFVRQFDDCGDPRYFRIGEPVSPTVVYSQIAGCLEFPPNTGYQYYTVGAEQPLSSFQTGTVSVD